MILGGASAAWPAPPAPLTTLRAVHDLSNAEASQELPVAFEATVTYCRAYDNTLFVQDGNTAIWVKIPADSKLLPGDRVLVQGTTHADFRADVHGETITVLRHGALPKPVPATFDELNHAKYDSTLVSVHGVVRAADQIFSTRAPVHSTRLNIITDGGDIDADVDSDDPAALTEFLDAEVEVTGVVWGRFDGKYQLTGNNLYVSSLASVKVLKPATASPWTLPVVPMDQIFAGYHVNELTQRTRVQGTITYYQPGSAVVLQNDTKSLWILTRAHTPLRIGDEADATGFPDVHDGFLTLTHGEVQDRHVQAFVQPQQATWRQITSSRHIFDLVSIEGMVVTAIREPSQDEYVLVSDGYMFSAIYRHLDQADAPSLPPMRQIPVGSRVRVTGICVMNTSSPFDRDVPFNILLRSFDDVVVVKRPSLLNVRNLVIVVGLLLVIVAVVGARGWALERKVRQKTAALAVSIEAEAALERRSALLEQKRSCVLEDINGSQTLANVLEKIAEMVSFRLDGAPCWCEVADGSMLGNCPPEPHGLRIVRVNIEARSGPALGALFAALAPQTPPAARETEALSNGARLATLAIETRRLYSDLRRRSEFDLLTDIYNRFSLHKRLDVLIQEAGQSGGIFGLIYIDLDKFKPVNDTFGHHVGDLYLQQVAGRMNDQLLGGDMMARLGGDEFAALVALQRGRSDLDKIVARLASCFDAPFVIEGHVIKGSASIGTAIFPEDSTTKDALLNAADAAMYAVKNGKRQIEK
jgi:diguanylate cyclase (GGDEF)-like protein